MPKEIFFVKGTLFAGVEGVTIILWLVSSKKSDNGAGAMMLQRIYEKQLPFLSYFNFNSGF